MFYDTVTHCCDNKALYCDTLAVNNGRVRFYFTIPTAIHKVLYQLTAMVRYHVISERRQ